MEAKQPIGLCSNCQRPYPLDRGVCPFDGYALVRPGELSFERGVQLDDRFVVLESLGHGGTAQAYRAFDTVSREMRALKVLHPELARRQGFVESFFEEARAMVDLEHENLVRIYGAQQTTDGLLYLILEYVQGFPLRRFITPRPTLPLRAMLEIVAQALCGLAHAHQAGFVHRDVKAENILVVRVPNRKTCARLVDFGLACLAGKPNGEISHLAGTPAIMSPEAIHGLPVGPTSDIYSVGLLLYEMVARRPAFPYEHAADALEANLYEAPAPLRPMAKSVGVPESFLACIDQCLHKNPEDRPSDVAAIQEEISKAVVALPDLGDNQAKLGTLPTVLLKGGRDQVTLQDWHLAEQPTLRSIEDVCETCGTPMAEGAVCLSCHRFLAMAPLPADLLDDPPRLRPCFQALWTASLGVLKVMAKDENSREALRADLAVTLNGTLERYGCEGVHIIATEEGFRLVLIAVDAVEGDFEDVMQASAQVLLNVVGATIKALHQTWSGPPAWGVCGAVGYGTVTPPGDREIGPDALIKGSPADLATRLQNLAKPWEVLAPSELFGADDLVDVLLVPTREMGDDDEVASCSVSAWKATEGSSRFIIEQGS